MKQSWSDKSTQKENDGYRHNTQSNVECQKIGGSQLAA